MTTRWTNHRLHDAAGTTTGGRIPINLWHVAQAAAEETLQGSLLAPAWLKLFQSHLSVRDPYFLRWREDFAESAEIRRAYSGLYGRFFARALLTQHLGFSRFISLARNGVKISGSVEVKRTKSGDIPDWLAWDSRNSNFVLCEAKGSLTANDFHNASGPSCVRSGKAQFGRVQTTSNGTTIYPAQWVAAVRWATDERGGTPTTVLWDPPSDGQPFTDGEAQVHFEAMTRAWLNSIASGFGYESADDILSAEREKNAVVVVAPNGPVPEERHWKDEDIHDDTLTDTIPDVGLAESPADEPDIPFSDSPVYEDRSDLLMPLPSEKKPHSAKYLLAVVNRFGIRPIRTSAELDSARRDQERAQALKEPAMLIGLPSKFSLEQRLGEKRWVDESGIAESGSLALFDLRTTEMKAPEGGLPS